MKHELNISNVPDLLQIDSNLTYAQVPGWLNQTTRELHLSVIRHQKCFDNHKFPVILWFAGGAWMDVDYNVHLADLTAYAKRGFVVVDVEYRDSNKTKFPGQLEDAKAAIRYLKKNAAKFQIDPTKIIAMGESAGGHLASMLGVTNDSEKFDVGDNLNFDSKVALAIPWSGVVDPLTTMNSNRTDDHNFMYRNFLGKKPDQSQILNDRADPLKYIDSKTVPFFILHGTDDSVVPISNAEELSQKLTEHNITNELYEIKGARHMDPKFWHPEITQLIVDFINNQLEN